MHEDIWSLFGDIMGEDGNLGIDTFIQRDTWPVPGLIMGTTVTTVSETSIIDEEEAFERPSEEFQALEW